MFVASVSHSRELWCPYDVWLQCRCRLCLFAILICRVSASGNLIQGWKKRWFYLKGGRLFYYKEDEDTPISFISLRTVLAITMAEGKKNTLCILTPKRPYNLKVSASLHYRSHSQTQTQTQTQTQIQTQTRHRHRHNSQIDTPPSPRASCHSQRVQHVTQSTVIALPIAG